MHPCQNCERDLPHDDAIDTGDRWNEKRVFRCPHCGARLWQWVPLFVGTFEGGWGWQLLPHQVPAAT